MSNKTICPLKKAAKITAVIFVIIPLLLFITASAYAQASPHNYDVKVNFGAIANGIADDKASIQNAINAAVADSGGTIYFRYGRYKIASDITFPASINIEFAAGAALSPGSGVTVTLNGGLANPDILTAIFQGDGLYAGNMPALAIRPEWFGAERNNLTDNNVAFTKMCAFVNQLGYQPTVLFTPGTYKYSGGLNFTREVNVSGDKGAVLNYTGTDKAMIMGPDGLVYATAWNHRNYKLSGLTFTGGTSMTHGVYFNELVQCPVVEDCQFKDFGQPGVYAIFFQFYNWHITVRGCYWFTTEGSPSCGSFLRVHGFSRAGAPDYGNSHLRMMDCVANNLSKMSGLGIYTNGYQSIFINNKIEAFNPCIQIGEYADQTQITDCYFETVKGVGPIQFGETSGGGNLHGVTVQNCYCNLHNTDFGSNCSFISPASAGATLSESRILNNVVSNTTIGRALVMQNNLTGQSGNIAEMNIVNSGNDGVIHTAANNIDEWWGSDGLIKIKKQFSAGKAQNGTLFEDAADGKLKYKNLKGKVLTLSN